MRDLREWRFEEALKLEKERMKANRYLREELCTSFDAIKSQHIQTPCNSVPMYSRNKDSV